MLLNVVAISCLLALAHGAPANSGPRITGHDAELGQLIHQVSLQQYWEGMWFHICGGSIINQNTVISSPACKREDIPLINLRIVAGFTSLTDKVNNGTVYKLNSFTPHEGWNSVTFENDIAVIKTNNEIEFNDLVGPIKLASYDIENAEAQLSGWYYNSHPGSSPTNLQWIETRTITRFWCSTLVGDSWTVFDSQICALPDDGKAICNGDVGGPLIRDGELHGIISGPDCTLGLPDLFTRLYSFIDWINAHDE